MLPNQRRERIIELLKEDGSAKVADLARLFKVTEVTIRQDLEKHEAEDLIIKEHGGAYLKNVEAQVKSFSLVHQDNLDKKEMIAEAINWATSHLLWCLTKNIIPTKTPITVSRISRFRMRI